MVRSFGEFAQGARRSDLVCTGYAETGFIGHWYLAAQSIRPSGPTQKPWHLSLTHYPVRQLPAGFVPPVVHLHGLF